MDDCVFTECRCSDKVMNGFSLNGKPGFPITKPHASRCMAPEYAIDGLFSVKSDVFSFGVLWFVQSWKLWMEGTALKLIGTSIKDSLQTSEVLRCIHVGLLCAQQRSGDMPNMSYVVLMLSSGTVSLPQPNQPGFYNEKRLVEVDSSSSGKMFSSNEITFTSIQGR
ncbi:hypothetical protein GIB67_021196 [Kingdonia uniflora]|uniref:S-locus receptor kinase C-terminal domain-containing protein n=1 Tax=Kingdonia uniflora TaxID=39325 RepID=A0A7J7LFR5_9MAGN|nr:hypothetical protein GIB67_021196 [Kingdonia uniflora]